MSSTSVEAVYENGVLRLARPINLADGTRVEVIVTPRPAESAEPTGPATRERGPAEVAAEIAALAETSPDRAFSGRDHDRILYGDRGAR